MEFYDASLSARLMKKRKSALYIYLYNRFSLRSCTKIDLVCTTTAIDRWYISGEKTLIEFFSFLRKRSFFPSLKMTKHYNYSSNHVFALQTNERGEKEMKEIWSLYTFPFYIWRRIGRNCSLCLKLIERKKKGGRACSRSPSILPCRSRKRTRPKIRERVCRVPLNPEILLPRGQPSSTFPLSPRVALSLFPRFDRFTEKHRHVLRPTCSSAP